MERISVRRLSMLTGAFVIVALAFAAVVPALAQDGGQGGSVTVGADDSLGDILGQFSLTEEQVVEFLRQNGDLEVEAGETVTFPASVTVNTGGAGGTGGNAGGGAAQATPTTDAGAGGGGAGGTDATPTTDAGGAGGTDATPTADAGGGAGGAQATPTADAGGGAGGGAGANQGFVCEVGDAQAGETYVTQEGDTFGTVLAMMGFQVDNAGGAGGTGGTGGNAGGGAGGAAQETPTADAGGGAGGGAGGTDATPTADAGGGTGGTGGTGGNAGGTGAQATTNQVVEFVYLNCDLDFVDDQTVTVPAGIPQTGGEGEAQATPTTDAGGAQATPTADAGGGAGGAQATPTQDAGGGAGGAQATPTAEAGGGAGGTGGTGQQQNYTVQAGDNLIELANRFGVTLEELVRANPNLLSAGDVLVIPAAGQGSTGQQGGQASGGGQGAGIPQTGGAGSVVADFGPGGNASLNLHLGRDTNLGGGKGLYVVQSGDTLSTIARRFNTTVAELMAMNTGIPDQNLIFRGQRLIVPGGEFPGQWNNNLLDINPTIQNQNQNQNGENTGEGGGEGGGG